ncbi:hypothetical protein [Paracoccus sp. MC1862]|uniref:hypothetical protein n=1 Tax=Paracoccus sp. MC1862 TaxID=2760307 RepID=UPI0016006504|nr:hypothetical protein [Paracoccus sp. MC1862]MBB1499327.1 hypothetical protein [Paracoccus sp. MC1862]QQO46634.1 hypothetical protein JGR78_16600 [Paracoccus sp. MC1862]
MFVLSFPGDRFMRLAILCGTATLAFAAWAEAQDARSWQSPDCTTLEAGSLEAALMDCSPPGTPLQDEVAGGEPSPLPAPTGTVTTVDVEPDTGTRMSPAQPQEPVLSHLAEGQGAKLPDGGGPSDVSRSSSARPAEPAGMIAELDPKSYELLQSIARAAGVSQVLDRNVGARQEERNQREGRAKDRDRKEGKRAGLKVPKGHRPPPGSCRIWYPDRPPGHQPPPTSCNVKVPRGAVLVR